MTKGKQKSVRRLVVVSNRLSFNVQIENGDIIFKPSAGGTCYRNGRCACRSLSGVIADR